MPDPVDETTWTPEDDDLVRRALQSLREDVDHLPLAAVDTVKGRASRRRRSTWVASGLGLAAAAAVVGAVALSGVLNSTPEVTAPATQSRTSITSSQTPSSPASSTSTAGETWQTTTDWPALLKQPGLLPTGAEWLATLGRTSGVTANESLVPTDLICGMTPGAGTAVTAQDVAVAGMSGPVGVQVTWIYPTDKAAHDAANAMRKTAGACARPKPETITQVSSEAYSAHPFMWQFSDTDGTVGWLTVTNRGRQVTYVEFWGQAAKKSLLTLDQFAWITNRVENRLQVYGESSSPKTVITGPPAGRPAAALFLDPADFASTVFTGGAETESGAGEFDGSSAVLPCDSDSDGQGEFGLLKIKLAGKDASYFATERVRSFADAGATHLAAITLDAAVRACTRDIAGNPVTVTAGPQPGTFAVATTLSDGSVITAFAAFQTSADATHLATLVLSPQKPVDHAAAFAELIRLQGLAAAR